MLRSVHVCVSNLDLSPLHRNVSYHTSLPFHPHPTPPLATPTALCLTSSAGRVCTRRFAHLPRVVALEGLKRGCCYSCRRRV